MYTLVLSPYPEASNLPFLFDKEKHLTLTESAVCSKMSANFKLGQHSSFLVFLKFLLEKNEVMIF